jgi:RNA-directed DNA polymerase
MRDRAMQALHALALKPIAETVGDRNSYGFREGRSCADAIGQCFCALAKSYAPVWVLEGDIKSCFDRISHQWLLANIPMDARMLRLWLEAGYWEKGQLFPTREGTPQGGIISPLLANLTLDGMEKAIRSRIKVRRDQVNRLHLPGAQAHTYDFRDDQTLPATRRREEPAHCRNLQLDGQGSRGAPHRAR